MAVVRKPLGEYLLDKGYVTEEQLAEANKVLANTKGSDLAKVLLDLGYAGEREIFEAKAQEQGHRFVDLDRVEIDSSALNVVKEQVVRSHSAIPIKKEGSNLWVAMSNANDLKATDEIRMASGLRVIPVLAVPGAIEDAIRRHYSGDKNGTPGSDPPGGGSGAVMQEMKAAIAAAGAKRDVDQVEDDKAAVELAEQAPIIKLANALIQQAIDERASDIHVEPQERNVRIRYRVDGVLHEAMTVPKAIQAPLVSRFKIMSEMNIAERRIPQDGRIEVRHAGKEYDLRVSDIPTPNGEKIVMRILDKTSILIGLDKLGFEADTQARLEELVEQPNGMVLSTGPTGSGKTTTQYSVLNKLNSIEKNIITIEDPIEYHLGGVAQVGVNRKAGLTFATALRSFLRQDPDIIMVGEMRDLETAEIAIEASLTGHLVLSTLHTNDAPSAVVRMVDMGVEPYLISATVIGVLAQRLARRICPRCAEKYEVRAAELRRFGFHPENPDEMISLNRGKGCEYCRFTGWRGRIGLYELMVMNAEIAELVVRRAPLADIKEASKANGMKELREDGLVKVLAGTTTPDEVMRVVFTAGY
jgi:type IV pilus assembly protein PilB